ncbi:hypothetical protein ABW19_dt0205598 [Dactylella cylindrospora]|nr:hypothetical protein ABW19_dt0205598 [Dactylella cylindrospora]
MSGNTNRDPTSGRPADTDDDENDMDYEPSESTTQESHEGTAATESNTEGEDSSEYLGIEALQALIRQALEGGGGGFDIDDNEDEDNDYEEEEGGNEGRNRRGTVEVIMGDGGDDIWGDSDDDQQVFTIVGNTFRVRLPPTRASRRRRENRDMSLGNLEPVPSEQGRELMSTGDFGFDMVVRMYDTSNPYDWKYYKSAEYPGGHWTITDASLSPDNKQLAYSSLDSAVYMARTQGDEEDDLMLLDFSDGPSRYRMGNGTPIWSIRFSGDGRELVAGAKDDSLYVYDIERQEPTLKLTGHTNDVNAVCYGDKSSPHILFSGSDDCTIKIWDRRSMASGREAGAFVGHMEGLTYIDSKGDGRYVLSNGKDQTMKLWDIRKLTDRSTYARSGIRNYSSGYDYRFENYDNQPIRKHPNDNSVVTFRGHRVLKTLIRCHFSPPTSSGGRYVYTGSEDGRVFVYNLDATIAAVIDVQQTTFDHRPQPPAYSWRGFGFSRGRMGWATCTRDASWHPTAPMIVSTSWNGHGEGQGSVGIHTWDGKIRGEGMTRDDFGYWNKTRRGLRNRNPDDEDREHSPVRTDELLQPLARPSVSAL